MSASDYVSYGGSTVAESIDVQGTLDYLRANGFADSYLSGARTAIKNHEQRRFEFEALNANYCDFCFVKLMGGEYDRLKDGRERCVRCSRTVVRTDEELRELYDSVKHNVEIAFDLSIDVAMRVRMVNAAAIARQTGERFQPTAGVDARVLGFSEQSRDGYTLYIENGSPKLAAITTIAHELTHIWQYINWDLREVERRYGENHRLAIYEGMATWAQVQYLLFTKEFEHADRQEAYSLQRSDEYGIGFRLFADRYPLSRDGDIDADSPFRRPFPL